MYTKTFLHMFPLKQLLFYRLNLSNPEISIEILENKNIEHDYFEIRWLSKLL